MSLALDLDALITAKVREEVRRSHDDLATAKVRAETVAAIFNQPFLVIPDDLMLALGASRSSAFEFAKRKDFPPTIKAGRKRMVARAKLVAMLEDLEERPHAD